jgi:putative glutamine amidotransferase
MKKLVLVLFFCLLVVYGKSQFTVSSTSNTVILVHPTKGNLVWFDFLVSNKIIDIENLRIIGLYHEKEVYDYSLAEKYVKEKNISYIKFQKITENISQDMIFQKNACSKVFEELFATSKGIIFTGGPDMPPSIYKEETSLLTEITDPFRHYFEISFLFHLLGNEQYPDFKPMLDKNPAYVVYGICLGMQTMNVATGGTMIQDIPSEIYKVNSVEQFLLQAQNQQHSNYYNKLVVDSLLFEGNFHEIAIKDLKPIIGNAKSVSMPLVLSIHHQAADKTGSNLSILATSADGNIIEALGHQMYANVLGVQFHPERIYLHNTELLRRISPNEPLVLGNDILKNHGSYEFHLSYWKEFARKISENK